MKTVMKRSCGAFLAVVLALGGCGGPGGGGTTASVPSELELLRVRAEAAPRDAALQRELALGELLLPGGDAERVSAQLDRALALSPSDPTLLYAKALERDHDGHPAEALALLGQALDAAHGSSDALAPYVAEAALSTLGDAQDQAPGWREAVQRAAETVRADGGRLGLPARAEATDLLVELAYRRGDVPAARALATELGCITAWRVAGPFGPYDLLGFDQTSPAAGPGAMAAEYDLGPGRGVRPVRELETRGCAVHVGGGPVGGGGTTVAEGFIDVREAGEQLVRIETPNALKLRIDGQEVVRLDARVEPTPRIGYHRVTLGAGRHEVEVELTSRHPNPILVVAVVPVSAAYEPLRGTELPEAGTAIGDGLRTLVSLARGDAVQARESIRRLAEPADATALVATLRGSIALLDPFTPSDVRRDRARTLFRRALERNPRAWFPALQLARLDAAEGRAVEALTALREAEARWPEVVGFVLSRADLLRGRGYDADAEAAVRKARGLVPDACIPIRMEYDAARARDRVTDAQRIAEQVMACDVRSDLRLSILVRQRKWAEALTELERLAALEPPQNQVNAISSRLELARARDDEAQTAALLTRLATELPRSADIVLAQADRLLAQGRQADARGALDAALTRDPAAMQPLARIRRAIGGLDDLRAFRQDGRAIVQRFEQSGRTYDGPQVLVFDYGATRVYPDGSSVQLIHQIYKVQSEEAVEELGEFAPPGRVLTLHTIKPDGRRLEPDEIEGKETISLPNLAPGDYVEHEYIVEADATPEGGYLADRFYFGSFEVPFDESTMVVAMPRAMQPVIDPRGPAPQTEERFEGDLRILEWTVRESRPLTPEAGSVAAREFLPSIALGVNVSWRDYPVGLWDNLLDKDVRDPAAERLVAEVLDEGGAREGSVEAKLRVLYRWVLENIEDSNDFFGSAPQMIAARTGPRARALRYLARLGGLDAQLIAARSRTGDNTESPLPDADTYGTALVRVPREGGDLVVFTGDRGTPFGWLPPALRGQDALVVGPTLVHVRVPELPLETDAVRIDVDVIVQDGGGAHVEIAETLHGGGAATWRQELEAIPEAELERRFEAGYVARLVPGAELETLTVEGRDDQDGPLVLRYAFNVRQIGRRTQGRLAIPPLFALGLADGYARLPQRTTALQVAGGAHRDVFVRVRNESGAPPTAPSAVDLQGPGGASLVVAARVENGALLVERHARVPQMRVLPADYAAFADFCRRFDQAEERELSVPLR